LSPQFQIHVHEVGNEPVPDPVGDIAEIGAVPRQSQFQYHVSEAPLLGSGTDAGAELCFVVPGGGVTGVVSGVPAVESGATAPPATLTCETGPLSPGLSMRTLTLTFAEEEAEAGGAIGVVEAVEGFGWGAAGGVSAAVSAVGGVISPAGPDCEAPSAIGAGPCVTVSPEGAAGTVSEGVLAGASTTGAASRPGAAPASAVTSGSGAAATASVAAVVAASASEATVGSCVGSVSSASAVEGATAATAVRRDTAAVQTTAGRSRCRRISKSSMRFNCNFHS
jgi:hypothetical protein